MRTNGVPPRPIGNSREAFFLQRVWDETFGAESQFIDSDTVTVEKSTRGITMRVAVPSLSTVMEFKLFLVTVQSPDTSPTVNVDEITLDDVGGYQTVSTFGTIAKPLHLRPESKPSLAHVVYPGYTLSAQNGNWITSVPRSWGLIIGFQPAFGTGLDGIDWMDTGMIQRDWARLLETCENGVPVQRYFHCSPTV